LVAEFVRKYLQIKDLRVSSTIATIYRRSYQTSNDSENGNRKVGIASFSLNLFHSINEWREVFPILLAICGAFPIWDCAFSGQG
jgi:hypothetical protein